MLSINGAWNNEQLDALATAPIDEYKKAFTSHSGADLRGMLANVLQFDRIVNATPPMREISLRAKGALKLIGAESPINARRVRRFGVLIEAATEEKGQARSG
jgi:hypothetical protein